MEENPSKATNDLKPKNIHCNDPSLMTPALSKDDNQCLLSVGNDKFWTRLKNEVI